jgi:hypothetical protein
MLLNLMPLTCFGQFSQRQLIDGNGFLSYPGSEGMTVADFDNDGRDDILIVARYYQYLYPGNVLDLNPNSASAGYRLMILKNDGFGFETEVDVLPPSDLSIDFLETADFDGNGFRDIMILRQGDIQMLFNFGPAGFQSTVIELDFTVNLDYRPYTADFNGDTLVVADAHDALSRQADDLQPDVVRLVVLGVHRGPEPVRGQLEVPGQQFPGVDDGVVLEVVPEAEVAQHLEEGVV